VKFMQVFRRPSAPPGGLAPVRRGIRGAAGAHRCGQVPGPARPTPGRVRWARWSLSYGGRRRPEICPIRPASQPRVGCQARDRVFAAGSSRCRRWGRSRADRPGASGLSHAWFGTNTASSPRRRSEGIERCGFSEIADARCDISGPGGAGVVGCAAQAVTVPRPGPEPWASFCPGLAFPWGEMPVGAGPHPGAAHGDPGRLPPPWRTTGTSCGHEHDAPYLPQDARNHA
jgi:hypothetical protein